MDDYDSESLDVVGRTIKETIYPTFEEYMDIIQSMQVSFNTDVFAKMKDESFHSSINQIKQTISGVDVYSSLEEKASNLLYLITKNHSFIDGNKRIAAACFLLFMQKNNALFVKEEKEIINNDTLALLTLYIANSKAEEHEVVKKLIISVLNRSS